MGRNRSNLAGIKAIERRLRAGYGQGVEAEYQPWLRVQDVPSKGDVYQVPGWKTRHRDYHLLSTLEYKYFMHLE